MSYNIQIPAVTIQIVDVPPPDPSPPADNVLYEIDFTAQPSQNLKANGDGLYTIAGKQWGAWNTGQASTFDLLNGTGIRIVRNGATNSPPRIENSVLGLATNALVFRKPLVLWMRIINNSPSIPNCWTHAQVFNSGLGSIQHAFGRIGSDFRLINDGVGGILNTQNNITDDVYVALIGTYQGAYFSGLWNNGWPAWSTLNPRGIAVWTPTSNVSPLLWNNGDQAQGSLAFGAAADEVTGGSAACSLTWTHLRIEQ